MAGKNKTSKTNNQSADATTFRWSYRELLNYSNSGNSRIWKDSAKQQTTWHFLHCSGFSIKGIFRTYPCSAPLPAILIQTPCLFRRKMMKMRLETKWWGQSDSKTLIMMFSRKWRVPWMLIFQMSKFIPVHITQSMLEPRHLHRKWYSLAPGKFDTNTRKRVVGSWTRPCKTTRRRSYQLIIKLTGYLWMTIRNSDEADEIASKVPDEVW